MLNQKQLFNLLTLLLRVFPKMNVQNVIASETEYSEAIPKFWRLVHSAIAALAMTVGHFFTWSVVIEAKPIIAQSNSQSSTNSNDSITQISFKPPPDDRKPDQTLGAGSRQDGQCPQDSMPSEQTSLRSLVPENNYGLTLAEHPTFWIYLPKTSAKQLVLSIREDGTKHHSQSFLPIPANPGIVSIKPTKDSPALQVGKNYQWAVVLVCGKRPGPNDPAIASWIRRVNLSKAQLVGKTALGQAAWYSEQGIWYDAITALSLVRQAQPDNSNLTQIWADFLQSAGLTAIY